MSIFFFFNDTATTEIYTLSLHDALPISHEAPARALGDVLAAGDAAAHVELLALHRRRAPLPALHHQRSEEHTSELQSPCNLVCRLLLEKKKKPSMTPLNDKTSSSSNRHS